MIRRSRHALLWIPLLAGGCVVSTPFSDQRLELENRSESKVFVRVGYRDPDAGRVEETLWLWPRDVRAPIRLNDSWQSLIRRVGQLTIDFCDERLRDTLQQVVVTERDLAAAEWRVVFPRP